VASDFLIAFATALGSAALLLSILFVCVKLFAPKKLDERIPISIPEPTVERSPVEPPIEVSVLPLLSPEFVSPELILCDVRLPGEIPGSEIIERLRQQGQKAPLLILTAQQSANSFMGPYRGKVTEPQERPRIPLSQTNPELLPTH
jgi:CheY-like chemotaxis protein